MTNPQSINVVARPKLDLAALDALAWMPALAFAFVFVISPLLTFSPTAESPGDLESNYGEADAAINITTADGSVLNKLAWILLAGAVVYLVLRIRRWRPRVNAPMILIFVYVIWSATTILWSYAPAIASRRLLLQITLLISVFGPCACGISPVVVMRRVALTCALAVIINYLKLPAIGLPAFGYHGIYGQKNGMGQVAFVVSVILAWRARGERRWSRLFWISMALGGVALCVLSKSKTSIALMAAIPLVAFPLAAASRLRQVSPGVLLSCAACLLLLGLLAVWSLNIDSSDISQVLFADRTFTGRTYIWAFAGTYIDERWLHGYGYGSFWGVGEDSPALSRDVGFIAGLLQSHNGYVDITLETGYVGLSIILALIVATYGAFLSATRRSQPLALTGLLIVTFVILNNLMESSLFRGAVPLWLALVLMIAILPGPRRSADRRG